MQTNNTLPHTIQPLQLHKNASQQTQTQHPSRAWILDKALVSHLSLVLLLWSTCWLLTGCDVPGSSLTPQPPTNLGGGPNQAYTVSLSDLTEQSSDEDFELFFKNNGFKAIWEVLDRCFSDPEVFAGIDETIIDQDPCLNDLPDKLRQVIALYIAHKRKSCIFHIDVLVQKRLAQEAAFRRLLFSYKASWVWYELQKPKHNQQSLSLKLLLKSLPPALRSPVLEDIVQFILNHRPDLLELDLSFNLLTTLPDSFEKLTKLQRLNLDGNVLTTLPACLKKLNLKVLTINNNPIYCSGEEQAFQTFLKNNNLNQIWEKLDQARGKNKLCLIGVLLKDDPALHSQVLEGIVRFIRNYLPDLRELELSYNRLTTLPDSFGKLINLHELNLQNNYLTELPKSFGELTNLEVLHLSFNRLKALPDSFINLTNLYYLDLRQNPYLMTTLPVSCHELINNIINWKGCELDGELKQYLTQDIPLRNLLQHNGLDAVWKILNQARGKYALDLKWMLRNCDSAVRTQVMPLIGQFILNYLPNLVELNLACNGLTELPDSFGKLEKLQTLYLHQNQLKALPANFVDLKQLQVLCLQSNKLQVLSDFWVTCFTNLHDLDLSDNQLQVLPRSFGNLINLRKLNLRTNKLTALPDSFGKLTNLNQLNLQNNCLKLLPKSFGQLEQLQILDLQYNQLEALPAKFVDLKQLQVLYLHQNQLKALPANFVDLAQLEILYLEANQLTKLPDNFGELTQLKKLHLDRNLLTQLPESLKKLTKLNIWTNEITLY